MVTWPWTNTTIKTSVLSYFPTSHMPTLIPAEYSKKCCPFWHYFVKSERICLSHCCNWYVLVKTLAGNCFCPDSLNQSLNHQQQKLANSLCDSFITTSATVVITHVNLAFFLKCVLEENLWGLAARVFFYEPNAPPVTQPTVSRHWPQPVASPHLDSSTTGLTVTSKEAAPFTLSLQCQYHTQQHAW